MELSPLFSLSAFLLFTTVFPALLPNLGKCRNVTVDRNHYINYNEGVWFPQYRSWSEPGSSCLTLYESALSDGAPRLEQQYYLTMNGEALLEPQIFYWETTEDRGIYQTVDYHPELEGFAGYSYILALNPKYRVRYLCTDYPKAEEEVAAVYLETRDLSPGLEVIREALGGMRRAGLRGGGLARIPQTACRRPLSHHGYQSTLDPVSLPPTSQSP